MKKDIRRAHLDVKESIQNFFKTYKRLFSASKPTAVLIFFSHLFLGLLPVLQLIVLLGLVDALIGARAIGVWTSDVQKYMWYQIALLLMSILPFFFISQLTGLSKKIGLVTAEAFFIASLFIAALPVSPILLFFLLVITFIVHYFEHKFILLVFSAIVMLLMVNEISEIFHVTVLRGATVGEALLFTGSLIVLSTWLALRPYIKRELVK